MHALLHWLLYLLTWLAHDPASLADERARCAGAVNVAYASLAQDPAPAPKREADAPAPPPTCLKCKGSGRVYRTDGGWVRCDCGACSTGRCPLPR